MRIFMSIGGGFILVIGRSYLLRATLITAIGITIVRVSGILFMPLVFVGAEIEHSISIPPNL